MDLNKYPFPSESVLDEVPNSYSETREGSGRKRKPNRHSVRYTPRGSSRSERGLPISSMFTI